MAFSEVTQLVPLETDADGVVRVGDTRVTLDTVITTFKNGATAEEIAQQYPLHLADIYAVISYYLRHTQAVEDYLSKRQEQAVKVREENETRFDPTGIRERLLARKR